MAFVEMLGVWVIIIGAILAVFALAGKLPGKKNIGTVVAIGFIVAGLVMAGPLLSGLLDVGGADDDSDQFGGAVYEVAFLDAEPWSAVAPADDSQIVNPAFTVMDILANDTNWAAISTSSVIDFIVARTDAGDADDTQIYYVDIGTVDTITDSSAGTTYTLIDFSDTTEAYAFDFSETTGTDNTPSLVMRNREFVAGAPGERHDLSVTFDMNAAAFGAGPSVVGASYTFGIVAAGSVLIVNCVVTAA